MGDTGSNQVDGFTHSGDDRRCLCIYTPAHSLAALLRASREREPTYEQTNLVLAADYFACCCALLRHLHEVNSKHATHHQYVPQL